ncbi:MAG: anhydro-N-acetylmuramic acid kinase [Bacteroidales bacterium]|nr:anhydro-N-acetylmuramic acid kinase [Bacteroidales bacterium]
MEKKAYNGIGVMSGTSLDGLDLAWCDFTENTNGRWSYSIREAVTIPYSESWKEKLRTSMELSAFEYALLDVRLGEYIGDCINRWLQGREHPQFIASHGHTVFHRPDLHLTTQIGHGASIAARTGILTICDFRTTDVALGGQGAPLVPIGDELLFGDYDACLNLGGFSNISFRKAGQRISFDVAPCNMALNLVASTVGMEYDQDGMLARRGQIIPSLLEELNHLDYYRQQAPKSLGKEWFESTFLPILGKHISKDRPEDLLRTLTEHLAMMIAGGVPDEAATMLTTGGGALNCYLIERLRQHTNAQVILPDIEVIQYKEALIFAFLGLLRLCNRNNCLKSVTGSEQDNCGGAIYA